MEWMEIFILVVVGIALAISLFYVTKGAADIGNSQDDNLEEAHKYLSWTSVVGWITIALVGLGIVLFLVFGEELVIFIGGWVITGLMLLVTAMTIAIGVLAAISATTIRKSDAYSDSSNTDYDNAREAHNDTIIAASISLGIVGVLLAGIFLYYAHKKRKTAAQHKAIQNLEATQLKLSLDNEAAAGKDKTGSV